MTNTMNFNPEQFIQEPYSFFALARANNPVFQTELFQSKSWLITGFKEVEAALKDPRFIREARKLFSADQLTALPEKVMPAVRLNQNMMLFRDAPDHTRLRNLVNKAFTPRMVEKLRPTISELADYLIDDMKGNTDHELIRDFSYLLPVFVITELLGIPKEDRHLFRKWGDAFISFIDFNKTLSDLELVADDITEASNYIRDLIAERRKNPKEDLISGLIVAEEAGDKLNLEELVATCMLLLIAGHETTVNLITNGMYILLKHPAQYELLRNDLSFIPSAVEETLRYESPVILTSRWAGEDFEFFGQQMKKADIVILALGGANYDPAINANPERFDITRKSIKHLSFASGPHFCLGAPLARLEAQIAFEKLITRLQNPILVEEPERRNNIAFRGLKRLVLQGEVL
jgi:pimeloyl-[acyl-carrier protein] synthase